MDGLQTPRGTKDILPQEQPYVDLVINSFRSVVESLGFQKIDTPTFEYRSVFVRSVGNESDIVEKELYQVQRLAGAEGSGSEAGRESTREPLVLRPEGTSAVARAYLEHGMQTWPQPVKLYYISSMFRYDRPQKGRYREHHQLGLELFGELGPHADATIMLAYWQFLSRIQLTDSIVFQVNSLGDETCRPRYRKKLKLYLESQRQHLCADCQRRLATNPLRVLDCKVESCREIASQAPVIIDELCLDCKNHLTTLLEYLDALKISYQLNPHLVRGLDYYRRTVFEVIDAYDAANQASISGGGRYDGLIKLLGGKDTPAVGTGIGIERIIDKLIERGIKPPVDTRPAISVIALGDKARIGALQVINQLAGTPYRLNFAFSKDSLKAQLKAAARERSMQAIIIGSRELFDQTVILRDMTTSLQHTVALAKLNQELVDRLLNYDPSQAPVAPIDPDDLAANPENPDNLLDPLTATTADAMSSAEERSPVEPSRDSQSSSESVSPEITSSESVSSETSSPDTASSESISSDQPDSKLSP